MIGDEDQSVMDDGQKDHHDHGVGGRSACEVAAYAAATEWGVRQVEETEAAAQDEDRDREREADCGDYDEDDASKASSSGRNSGAISPQDSRRSFLDGRLTVHG